MSILKADLHPQITNFLYHSETLNFIRVIAGKWFNHFSSRFLFIEGDWENPRFSSPYVGQLLIMDIVLLVLGSVLAFRNLKRNYWLFIVLWLMLAPLPAILSRDQVHAARSLNMVVPLVLLEGLGCYFLIILAKTFRFWKIFLGFFLISYLLNFAYYLDSYYIHLPKSYAKHWDYGYREAVKLLDQPEFRSKPIVFQQSYEQPFIYFLFYWKISPDEFLKDVRFEESSVGDVGLVTTLNEGRISFRGLSAPFKVPTGTIVVANPIASPPDLMKEDYTTIKEIKYPGKESTAFRIFEAK